MATAHVARYPTHLPHQHSTSSSSAPASHSPFRRVNRIVYAPPAPAGKSSSASQAAAATAASSSSKSSRSHHHHSSCSSYAAPAPSGASSASSSCADTYFGHENTSKLCARFVSHTFNCPETIPLPSNANAVASRSSSSAGPQPPLQIPNTLAHFVAYALHRTRLHPSVVFTALALLHRLKSRFPAARGSSGHRLFLASYMLASKVVCDDTYSNKSWAVVGQGMFALREINQMEREMLGYLEWSLNIPGEDLMKFENEVRRIYGCDRSDRGSFGRGIEMRLIAGVGGAKPTEKDELEEDSSCLTTLAIPVIGGNSEKAIPHQLPTPTDAGPAVVPARPVLPPISTSVPKRSAYPSPPQSPSSVPASKALKANESDCSSASTSPVDGDSDREDSEAEEGEDAYPYEGDGSPSPTSSEDSATLPTPPNSALSAGPQRHGYGGYPQKMSKSHSVPGFVYAARDVSAHGRSSAPPSQKREPVVSSVSASHFGSFSASVEEDGDAVMDLEDEKRGGMTYYATVHRPASAIAMQPSRASASAATRKDTSMTREREREARESRKERERSLKTFTVPCAW